MIVKRIAILGLGLGLACGAAPLCAQNGSDIAPNFVTIEPGRPHAEELDKAVKFLLNGKPAEAEKIFSKIIADFEAKHDPAVPYRCAYANTAKATIEHASKALNGKAFILGSDVWCAALWGKGFALIDLGRSEEAGAFLARSVEMAPLEAHYINEYAEWFKSRKDWKQSFALFERAWSIANRHTDDPNRRVTARSLRGIGFTLIELGDLDQAEMWFKLSLDYEPEAAARVKGELDYIAELRGKK